MKIKINGFSYNEVKEFEILERREIEEILDEINSEEVFRRTMEMACSYYHSGMAYTYLDARDGEVKTSWLGSNSFLHPWDSFYEIVLCRLETGAGRIDFDTPILLLNEEEQEEYRYYSGNIKEYLKEKYNEEEYEQRVNDAINYLSLEFELDYQEIYEQLNKLYSR